MSVVNYVKAKSLIKLLESLHNSYIALLLYNDCCTNNYLNTCKLTRPPAFANNTFLQFPTVLQLHQSFCYWLILNNSSIESISYGSPSEGETSICLLPLTEHLRKTNNRISLYWDKIQLLIYAKFKKFLPASICIWRHLPLFFKVDGYQVDLEDKTS